MVRGLVHTLRPHQWVKNLFVAAPLVFAQKLLDGTALLRALVAVAAFCALSGAVYALNDVLDVERDRAHPVKRLRPIAAGVLSTTTALWAAGLLAAMALGAATATSLAFGAVAAGYLVLNLAYSLSLKHIAYVDVAVLAGGFLLRVLGGSFAVRVDPSPWLFACTGLLAAFLGFGKRAHELAQASAVGEVGATRRVLTQYRPAQLRFALYLLGAATSAAYILYTRAPHTVEFFGTTRMLWTAPFCLFGIGRFLLLTRQARGDSPTEAMLRDIPFMANLTLWGGAVLYIIYSR